MSWKFDEFHFDGFAASGSDFCFSLKKIDFTSNLGKKVKLRKKNILWEKLPMDGKSIKKSCWRSIKVEDGFEALALFF